ncbi:hypothetical protein PMAC_001226 [Pneumocystis sp. 'macacae']|nr:hypothetical protein PMAC_001226 [Pneumocystis sp. 'macacae']
MRLIFSLFVSLLHIAQYGKPFKLHDFDKPAKNSNINSPSSSVKVLQEDFIKAHVDRASYRLIRLEKNGIEILLVSDPNSNKAGASVNVGAGSLHDPENFPGIAHFCEHLVFLGTEKYPIENDYESYISTHGGFYNAFTELTNTNYFFEIDADFLYGALDRLAQFFYAPLFLEDSVRRESYAVDSEHKKNLRSDDWARHEVQKLTYNKTHPIIKFSTGTLQTLNTDPKSKGKNITDEVRTFFQKYYVSRSMKAAVYGKESLDELQRISVEIFSQIPNKEEVSEFKSSPLDGKLGISGGNQLYLEFPIPNQLPLYKSHPLSYLRYILTFEGQNSPLKYLRINNYARSIRLEYIHIHEGADILTVILDLDSNQALKYENTIKAFFECINYYKGIGPKREVVEELITTQNMNFNYRLEGTISDYLLELTVAMKNKHISYEHLLSSTILKEYNESDITNLLNALTPLNFRASLGLKSDTINFNQTEPYYGTKYLESTLNVTFLGTLQNVKPEEKVKLGFPQNTYVSRLPNITMEKLDDPPIRPVLYRESELSSLWYVYGSYFHAPRGTITVLFRNPMPHLSPSENVKLDFIVTYLRYVLEAESYYSSMAGTEFYFDSLYHGLVMKIDGYTDKIMEIFDTLMKTIHRLSIHYHDFYGLRDDLIYKYLSSSFLRPFERIKVESKRTFMVTYRNPKELAHEAHHTESDELNAFIYDFFTNLHIDILVTGNIPPEDVLHISYMAEAVFETRYILPSEFINARAITLENDSKYFRLFNVTDPKDPNSAIHYYCEVTDITETKEISALNVLSRIMNQPVFDVLRTKEQLGYLVRSSYVQWAAVAGFQIMVQSERQPHVLESRINDFLKNFLKYLDNLTDEEISHHVNSILNSQKNKPRNMLEEAKKMWSKIYHRTYDFDTYNETVKNYKFLKKNDLVDLFKRTLYYDSKVQRKKFSQHVSSFLARDIFNVNDIPFDKLYSYLSQIGVSVPNQQLKEIFLVSHDTTTFIEKLADYMVKNNSINGNSEDKKKQYSTGIYTYLTSEYSSQKKIFEEQLGKLIDDITEFKTKSTLSRALFSPLLVKSKSK